jgi:hypothetical protein
MPEILEKDHTGPNPAAGFELLGRPVGGALDAIHSLVGIAVGGVLGAMVGGVIGAGVATSEKGQSSSSSAPELPPEIWDEPIQEID